MEIYQDNLNLALHPLRDFLSDPGVTDVMINPDGSVWFQRFREEIVYSGRKMSFNETIQIINFTAHMLDVEVNKGNPTLYGAVPGHGCRIQAQVPPRSPGPAIALRKKNLNVNPLEKYCDEKRISSSQLSAIQEAVSQGVNMVISGPVNSGKTSLMNAIIKETYKLAPRDRLYIVEDTDELVYPEEANILPVLVPSHKTAEALSHFLRWNARRILFGELREPAPALEFFSALNVGAKGAGTTIHANNAKDALSRLWLLIDKNNRGLFSRKEFAERIQMVIHLNNIPGRGPVVTEIIQTAPTVKADDWVIEKHIN